MRRPFRILEDHVSYDERQNNGLNFHLKEKKIDIWRARNLTLFGEVMINKSIGLSQLVYSAQTLNVPKEITSTLKNKTIWLSLEQKKIKLKERAFTKTSIEKGALRMTNPQIMFLAVKLGWIPRLLTSGNLNWKKKIIDYYLRIVGNQCEKYLA